MFDTVRHNLGSRLSAAERPVHADVRASVSHPWRQLRRPVLCPRSVGPRRPLGVDFDHVFLEQNDVMRQVPEA